MTRRWEILGDPEAFERMRQDCDGFVRSKSRMAEWVEVDGRRCYRKGGPLGGKSRVRHALRGWLMRSPLPRLREFKNLEWLRAHGFGAAEPVLAAGCFEGGLPRYQLLCVREIEGAIEMGELLEAGPVGERASALEVLAREVGRLHGAGFVHRDLFPRNVLWRAGDRSVHFVDAWRGGPGVGMRGPLYDLGCWMVFGVELMTESEVADFLQVYAQARTAAGGVMERSWLQAVRKERRRVVRRLERQQARGSSLPAVRREW